MTNELALGAPGAGAGRKGLPNLNLSLNKGHWRETGGYYIL
jgi:hypothetical protein